MEHAALYGKCELASCFVCQIDSNTCNLVIGEIYSTAFIQVHVKCRYVHTVASDAQFSILLIIVLFV